MSLTITLSILFAAMVHASWNALVKANGDPYLNIVLLCAGKLTLALCILPFLPLPAAESFPFLCASVAIHIFYFLFLAESYKHADLSIVYPILRGLPPVFVAVASIILIGEYPSLYGWIGMFIIFSSIILLKLDNFLYGIKKIRRGLLFAIFTACTITAYTLIDGIGARLSGNSFRYLIWQGFFTAFCFLIVMIKLRGKNILLSHVSLHWRKTLLIGAMCYLAYGIVLWAMTQAPIAYVSSLRETSVFFGSLIGIILLKEQPTRYKIVASVLIVTGIIILKIA